MQHSRVWPWVEVFGAFWCPWVSWILSFVCFAFRLGRGIVQSWSTGFWEHAKLFVMPWIGSGPGFRLLGFCEFEDVWIVWTLQFWGFRACGPRNSTGTVHERPLACLGHSGLHFGYGSGIVLSNLRTSANFQDFHPEAPWLNPKLPTPSLERNQEPRATMATLLHWGFRLSGVPCRFTGHC